MTCRLGSDSSCAVAKISRLVGARREGREPAAPSVKIQNDVAESRAALANRQHAQPPPTSPTLSAVYVY